MEAVYLSSMSEEEEEGGEGEVEYIYDSSDINGDNDDGAGFLDGIMDVTTPDSFSFSTSPVCQVITRESLLAAQSADIQKVMDLLLVREHHARTLLIRYQWDVDRLFTVYVEKGEAHLFAEAGATLLEHVDSLADHSTYFCDICIEDVPCDEVTRMDCGHTFCNNCWTEHFIVKINDGQSRRIRCMAHTCKCICDEGVVRNLVSKRHRDLAEKFDRFLLESYIDDNKKVKWCPSIPHCGNAIRTLDDAFCEVECTCGLQFCFSCLSEAHSPCSCLMWELWSKKCKDESESVKWMTVNTKNCPTCMKPVEKNGGCNVVRCICGGIFCWLCGQNYFRHNCTRYTAPPTVKQAKNYLYRYMHYFNRYKGHKDSMKLEANMENTIRKKVSIIQAKVPEIRDFSWVKMGIYRLFRSRSIMAYSYAFGFYMFGDDLFKDEMTYQERLIKQNLFEDQQQQLESKVEKLSGLLEMLFHVYTDERVKHIREQVIVTSHLVDDLCKKMYNFIQNDLLGALQLNTHIIAPYRSKGIVQASELAIQRPAPNNDGYLKETDEAASSGASSESEERPNKRAKSDDSSSYWDLNLPVVHS